MDTDGPREKYHNLEMNQYHDPKYGFVLSELLDKYAIKALENPKERLRLKTGLKNGGRVMVEAERNGKVDKMQFEASPRYTQVNFYNELVRERKGKPF
jgi:hypothetical protein